MMLGFPLDYRSLEFIDQAVSSFGKLVTWHNNQRSLGYVLVKCLYNGAQSVPRSLVFRQGERNGTAWSWNVPVYVLNWEGLDDHHAEMEDVPPDGNPHPMPQAPLDPDLHQAEDIADQIMDNELPAHQLQHDQLDPWEAAAQAEDQGNQGWPTWHQPPPPQAQMEVQFGQDGSLDDHILFNPEVQANDNLEVQSKEEFELQLVVHGREDIAPSWIAPFDSPQLRKLLAAAILPQTQESIPWWCNNAVSSSSQAQPISALTQPEVVRHVLLLGPPPAPEEVYTINNNLITKVYFRRKFKAVKRSTLAKDKDPIFEQIVPDYSVLEGDLGSNTLSLKKKPTPASVTNLRRSKRQAGRNDGFKPSSPVVTRSKSKAKKKLIGPGSSTGKTHTFLLPQAEKVANQSNSELLSLSPTRSLGPPHIQINIQIGYDPHFGHSTYARKDKDINFTMALVSCPTKIGVIRNH
jgi:hypothetical protein